MPQMSRGFAQAKRVKHLHARGTRRGMTNALTAWIYTIIDPTKTLERYCICFNEQLTNSKLKPSMKSVSAALKSYEEFLKWQKYSARNVRRQLTQSKRALESLGISDDSSGNRCEPYDEILISSV